MDLKTFLALPGASRKTWLTNTVACLDRGADLFEVERTEYERIAQEILLTSKSDTMKDLARRLTTGIFDLRQMEAEKERQSRRPDYDTREEEARDHADDLAQQAYDAMTPEQQAAQDKADGMPEPPAFLEQESAFGPPPTPADIKKLDAAIKAEALFLNSPDGEPYASPGVRVVCKNKIRTNPNPKADLALPLFRRCPEMFQ
jgi:hypothetical protein